MKITNKMIAEAVGRTPQAISHMRKNSPKMYEVLKAGIIHLGNCDAVQAKQSIDESKRG